MMKNWNSLIMIITNFEKWFRKGEISLARSTHLIKRRKKKLVIVARCKQNIWSFCVSQVKFFDFKSNKKFILFSVINIKAKWRMAPEKHRRW